MLLFGHAGITFGVAAATAHVMARMRRDTSAGGSSTPLRRRVPDWMNLAREYVDLRLVFVGALLPDLIDKPVGHYLFPETFSSGRIFAHTLLFVLVLTAFALLLRRVRGDTMLLALAFGSIMHLLLDTIWLAPQVLFWPLFGFAFPRQHLAGWEREMLSAMVTQPETVVSELAGILIVVSFGVFLVRKGLLKAFRTNKYPEA